MFWKSVALIASRAIGDCWKTSLARVLVVCEGGYVGLYGRYGMASDWINKPLLRLNTNKLLRGQTSESPLLNSSLAEPLYSTDRD